MWKPNQLLNEETLKTLREAGFSELKLEFLGWLSYYAKAINDSKNPAKAAHTILARDSAEKMLLAFTKKKQESVRPKERAEHEALDQEFRKLEKWIEQVEDDVIADREPQFDS